MTRISKLQLFELLKKKCPAKNNSSSNVSKSSVEWYTIGQNTIGQGTITNQSTSQTINATIIPNNVYYNGSGNNIQFSDGSYLTYDPSNNSVSASTEYGANSVYTTWFILSIPKQMSTYEKQYDDILAYFYDTIYQESP